MTTRTTPRDHVAIHIGNRDLGVIESSKNVRDPDGDVLGVLGLDDFLARLIIAEQLSRRGRRAGHRATSSGSFASCGSVSQGRNSLTGYSLILSNSLFNISAILELGVTIKSGLSSAHFPIKKERMESIPLISSSIGFGKCGRSS